MPMQNSQSFHLRLDKNLNYDILNSTLHKKGYRNKESKNWFIFIIFFEDGKSTELFTDIYQEFLDER